MADKLVHLLTTREGMACGATPSLCIGNADINRVTCEVCRELHDDNPPLVSQLHELVEKYGPIKVLDQLSVVFQDMGTDAHAEGKQLESGRWRMVATLLSLAQEKAVQAVSDKTAEELAKPP